MENNLLSALDKIYPIPVVSDFKTYQEYLSAKKENDLQRFAFEVGAAHREKHDLKEPIELYPVSVKPKKHGLYWVILKAHPINYMQVMTQKQYGEDSEGEIGWLSEDDDGRVTHWFEIEKFSAPTPIPSDIVEQLQKANPWTNKNKSSQGYKYVGFVTCLSKLRELLSTQTSGNQTEKKEDKS